MSRFHGSYPGQKLDRGMSRKKGPKGVLARYRAQLREEAEERDKETKPENRRQYRLKKQKEEKE